MNEYSVEEVRSRFEAWVSVQAWVKATIGLKPSRNGDEFADPCINSRWQGWQAAYAERIKADEWAVPVAEVGRDWTLHWVGHEPIAPIITENNIRIGDKLFTRPPAQAGENAALRALQERTKVDDGVVPALWIEFTDDGQNIRLWTRNGKQASEEIREGRKLLAFYAGNPTQPLNEQSGISGQLEFLKGILEGLSMAKSECDNRVFALDGGGNQFRREATASQCAEAIQLVYVRMFREMTAMPAAHPPAQAAQLWEMKQRACRAHALCNELRLAHPEIPEFGDDGVLHEAIHDILRVDTPTAASAQAAQETPCSLNEALVVIEVWADRGGQLDGDDASRLRAIVDRIAPAAEPVAQGEAVCPKCGAMSVEDAATRCRPDVDSCPGCEMPLTQEWDRQAAQPRAVPDVAMAVLRDLNRAISTNASGAGIDHDKRPTDYKAGMVKAYEHCLDLVRSRITARAALNRTAAAQHDLYFGHILRRHGVSPDIKAMADRFLGWRLPDDFMPDAGISFAKPTNPAWWPTGTNLLTAAQAEQMFRHVLAAAPSPGES